ncbi:hypothetical protein AUP43_02345 [Oceanibaculum pacificum]|uniref:HEPN AbiJ-N-terminal domain-containing protein n=2 Tax=Oceanibaculum pacificum TaxID=580166 RepID=A0A154W1P7_9PROT|nr:hypothetical protein AUP43_02345 [Oceanibaculum pacificum]
MTEAFSDRHGYRGTDAEITVREDAPEGLRYAIPLIAHGIGMSPTAMRRVICQVLLVPPDPSNWSNYPNIWGEVNELIEDCPWYKVYDVAEALHDAFERTDPDCARQFTDRLNQYFRENGIGWDMRKGRFVFRGSEVFQEATTEAASVLMDAGRERAASEIHEALRDISRRPDPDITGAMQHAIAALEATARDVAGEPNRTLGQLVRNLSLPAPLDAAVVKLWGYASDRARHVREGQEIDTAEAELLVSVACAVCTFLSRRNSP